MRFSNITQRASKVVQFVGPRVLLVLFLSLMVGVTLFFVEVAIAYSLQAFFVALGLMSNTSLSLPQWVPQTGLYSVLLFIFVTGALKGLLQVAQVYFQSAISEESNFAQRTRVLQWAFHSESASSSQATELFYERSGALANILSALQGILVQSTMALLMGLQLFLMSFSLTVIIAFILLLFFILLRSLDLKIKELGDKIGTEWSQINRRLLMSLKNILLLQIYGMQDHEKNLTQKNLTLFRKHSLRAQLLTGIKLGAQQVLAVAVVCIFAIFVKSTAQIETHILIPYFYILIRLLQSVSAITLAGTTVVRFAPRMPQFYQWWMNNFSVDFSKSIFESTKQNSLHVESDPIGWQLSNVTFSYTHAKGSIFENLNLQINPGEIFIITGPSGVGKTTLLALLLGNLKPQGGSIEYLFNHAQIFPVADYRSNILEKVGYVGPESFLLEGSIRDSLVYGQKKIVSDEVISEALTKAECQFVFDLPRGLNHVLTEQGQGLSAGQKQRLSMARALLRDPKILILDEATANLDLETEARLITTLLSFKGRMTVIAATHRPAFLTIADQVLDLSSFQLRRLKHYKDQFYSDLNLSHPETMK